jgi:hypothetical protein
MNGNQYENGDKGVRPRDLVDFHLRWLTFRSEAIVAAEDHRLTNETRETIRWLIAMADRIGARDLQ